MKKFYQKTILMTIALVLCWAMPIFAAPQRILFLQKESKQMSLYVYDYTKAECRCLRTGKNLNVRSSGTHLLYTEDNKLYHYDLQKNCEFFVARFNEEIIYLDDTAEEINQVTLITRPTHFSEALNYYVLDFNDNNLRFVPRPKNNSDFNNKITVLSPNAKAEAKVALGITRCTLEIEKEKKIWTLPKGMSLFPERPLWSPDSQKLAFYAKNIRQSSGIYEGFFSLYILDISKIPAELLPVQADVFVRYYFDPLTSGGFSPSWKKDSEKLLYAYLPYGSPNESSLMEYDISTGVSNELYRASGKNYYPQFSNDEESILFVSNRYGNERLFLLSSGKAEPISSENGDVVWYSF